MGIAENEKALLECNDFEPFRYGWAFWVLKSKYQEKEGVPIVRIMSRLISLVRVSCSELEHWVRNPECIWGWLVRKRNGLKAAWELTNRGT